MPERMSDKHRRRILDIICACMEMRVQSELRPFRKNTAMGAPWHLSSFRAYSVLERIPPYSHGSRAVKSRKSDKGIIAPYRLFKIFPERFLYHVYDLSFEGSKPSGYIEGSIPSGILPSDIATSESTILSRASLILLPSKVFIMKLSSASTTIWKSVL